MHYMRAKEMQLHIDDVMTPHDDDALSNASSTPKATRKNRAAPVASASKTSTPSKPPLPPHQTNKPPQRSKLHKTAQEVTNRLYPGSRPRADSERGPSQRRSAPPPNTLPKPRSAPRLRGLASGLKQLLPGLKKGGSSQKLGSSSSLPSVPETADEAKASPPLSKKQRKQDSTSRGKNKTAQRPRSWAAPEKPSQKKKHQQQAPADDAYDVLDLSGSEQLHVSLDSLSGESMDDVTGILRESPDGREKNDAPDRSAATSPSSGLPAVQVSFVSQLHASPALIVTSPDQDKKQVLPTADDVEPPEQVPTCAVTSAGVSSRERLQTLGQSADSEDMKVMTSTLKRSHESSSDDDVTSASRALAKHQRPDDVTPEDLPTDVDPVAVFPVTCDVEMTQSSTSLCSDSAVTSRAHLQQLKSARRSLTFYFRSGAKSSPELTSRKMQVRFAEEDELLDVTRSSSRSQPCQCLRHPTSSV